MNTHCQDGRQKRVGRPKKRPSELQKTHTLRATDKDWKEIQLAARVIKSCHSETKRPQIFFLTKEETANVHKFLIDGFIERRHKELWGEETPAPEQPPVRPRVIPEKIETPQNLSEEEAVSLFLEYYRLNSIDATNMVQSRLDKERHLAELREFRKKQKAKMEKFDEQTQEVFDNIDDLNERIANMLRFPGQQTPRKY